MKKLYTMYIGDPHSVAAITPSCRNRANPKSAEITAQQSLVKHQKLIVYCKYASKQNFEVGKVIINL